jgi:peptide/nickel transport system substrate-binding protein
MRRYTIEFLKGAGFAALVSAGLCTGPAAAQQQTTLRLVPQADLRNIDPVWTTAAITRNHGYMVYDVLFSMDSTFTPKPQMVDSWTVSPDGMTYSFTLRSGMKWHDGTPVRGADAAQSIKRWAVKSGDGKVMMNRVASLEATGDLTFQLVLKEKFGLVLHILANPVLPAFIMRESDAKISADEQVKEAIGSGPFIFKKEEWVPGNKVVYVKNKDYVARSEPVNGFAGGKAPKVDRVEWIYIPDTNTATQALLAGEVDAYEIPPFDLLPLLKRDPNIVVAVLDNVGTMGHVRPNHLHPPFNNVKVRQAMGYTVDQKAYLAAMVGAREYEKECYAVFMCGSPLETSAGAAPFMKPDYEKSKQLLKEAGYNNEPIILLAPTDQQIIFNIAQVAAEQLRKGGFNIEMQSMDWSTLTSRRPNKSAPGPGSPGWHLFPTWWTGIPLSSPVSNLPLAGDANWFGWYNDSEIEKLRAEFLAAGSPQEQKAIAEKLQLRYYEQVPYLNTGQFFKPVAYRKNLVGVPNATEFVLWNIEKK